MSLKFPILLLLIVPFLPGTGNAQVTNGGVAMMGRVINGDTILFYTLPEIRIYEDRIFKNKMERRKYDRLVYNVKKVYPYAQLAVKLVEQYNKEMEAMERNREKKKYISHIEKELFSKYKSDIESLTITQGRILIKLIDRQTGKTSYDIIKNYRGSFPAYFWQSIAIIFGSDLKYRYDPKGEDRMIEDIVLLIEGGQI
ncbi:MAG: DUF4294 domain-containing protein [Bacteroidetes bacterium]|nr:DUF4294 domain-containing protein [Bacteroidota bacterium]